MNGRSDLEELQLVIFTVGETEFGIHISAVREIIAPSKLVSLPSMPPSMVGITNVRGTVLPIVDLKSRFAMGCSQLEEYESQKSSSWKLEVQWSVTWWMLYRRY